LGVKLSNIWTVVLAAVMFSMLPGQSMAQVSIMAVGDSITQGVRGDCSYRRPLSQALIQNSCNVNFVGPRMTAGNFGTANLPPLPNCAPQNTNHLAISGYRANQILSNSAYDFDTELNTKQPDIVLLHIGSNDIAQNRTINATVNSIDEIIDRVFVQRPAATVVVADVIPWSEEAVVLDDFIGYVVEERDMLADTAALSAAIKALVDSRAASGEAVVLVEVKDGFDNNLMTSDGVHPNPVGEAHIANKMLNALYGLGVCGSNPPDVQAPITYISIPSAENEQLSTSPLFSGTALDEGGSGFSRVRIAIEDTDLLASGVKDRWWIPSTGVIGAFDGSIEATMAETDIGSTSWSYTTDLPPGNYRLYALALDTNDNQVEEAVPRNDDPNNTEKVWTSRTFSVVEGLPTSAPAFTSPMAESQLNFGSTDFSWNANGVPVTEWWIYAGNSTEGRGQFSYYNSGSLPAGTTSSMVTGLPGNSSTVYLTLWYKTENSAWQSVITDYQAASSGGPAISSPENGTTLSSSTETFTWASNGDTVDEYWLYVGEGVNQYQYYNSGLLTGTSVEVPSLPTNGESLFVRLWFREADGRWQSTDSTYTAAQMDLPSMTNPTTNGSAISSNQSFNWSANETNVDEWWLYAGSSPGGFEYYNSRSLGGATSDAVSGLPSGANVYVTLWFRAEGGKWYSLPYNYTVE